MPNEAKSYQGGAVEDWLEEHGIAAVRIEGTNLDGSLIGKRVSVSKFLASVESGFAFSDVAFGIDLGDVPYFGFAMPAWRGNLDDISMHVDLGTLLDWGGGQASIIGDFWTREGEPLAVCPRNTLKRIVAEGSEMGYGAVAAIEIEATVFEESIHEARAKGYDQMSPLGGTSGAAYHLVKSADWDEYMTCVQHRLTELGIVWEAWSDEAASGQIEINLAASDPVSVCDDWARTRQVMREVAFELGRSVTFMAKWCSEYGQASHLNISLQRDEFNVFFGEDGPTESMRWFIGGLIATLPAATSFAFPWITSYRRLAELEGPPTTVTWGVGNKTAAIRAVVGHKKYSRLEYRIPGADANVYLVMAAVLGAGFRGIRDQVEPPEPCDAMAWCLPNSVARIPSSIPLAARALADDELLTDVVGRELVDYWIGTRMWEWLCFHTQGGDPDAEFTDWERNRYFELA